MTLIEVLQRHFDELAGEGWGKVVQVHVRFDDGTSVDVELDSLEDRGTTLIRGTLPTRSS